MLSLLGGKTRLKMLTFIAFGELFKPDSPEYILKHAKPILDRFNHNIEVTLRFSQVRPSEDYSAVEECNVGIELRYAGKKIK